MVARAYPKMNLKRPKLRTLPLPGWLRGLNTLVNPNQIREDELAEAVNVAYAQYGVIKPRKGSSLVVNLENAPVQGFGVYNKRDGAGNITRYFCAVCNGHFYTIDPINKTKTLIAGKTFHATNPVTMIQGLNYLYIFDGLNPITKWDAVSFTAFTTLTTPLVPVLTKNGSGTGTKTYSYIITACSAAGGETVGSPAAQLASMPSPLNTATFIGITWTAVPNATQYNIYRGSPGNETFLTAVTEAAFNDQGQADATASLLILPPTVNSTAGPVFTVAEIYHSSVIGVDNSNKSRIWFSAGLDRIDSYSPGEGGGWFDYHPEDGESVNALKVFAGLGRDYLYLFKDHKTGQMNFVATTGFAGAVTVADINITVGAASSSSVVPFDNDLAFWSRYGAYTLRMEANFLSILRVSELSIKVHPTLVDPINQKYISKIAGIYNKSNHVLIWSVPLGSNTVNSTSVAFDPLYLGFAEYRGIAGVCFVNFVDANNGEFSYSGDTAGNVLLLYSGGSDNGASIYFRAATKVVDMDQAYAYKYFDRVIFIFGNVNASNFSVSLIQDGLTLLKQFSVTTPSGAAGWDTDFWGKVLFDTSAGTPVSILVRSVLRFFDIKKDLFSVQTIFEDTSTTDSFEILQMFFNWRESNKPLPSASRVS